MSNVWWNHLNSVSHLNDWGLPVYCSLGYMIYKFSLRFFIPQTFLFQSFIIGGKNWSEHYKFALWKKISISDIKGYGWFICSISWRTAYIFYGYPKLRGPQRRTKLNLREYWRDKSCVFHVFPIYDGWPFFNFLYPRNTSAWLDWNAVTLKCMREFKQPLNFLSSLLFYMISVYQFKIYIICIFNEEVWSFDMNLFPF